MYRIILSCSGVPAEAGPTGATDIAEEFTHRPWHKNVTCVWDAGRVVLCAENDFDSDGRAMMDEFSDAIAACIKDGFNGQIKIESVTRA